MRAIYSSLSITTRIAMVVCAGLLLSTPTNATVYVAVASNFADAQAALAKAFEKTSGNAVKASSGSTGKLYAQIENGGPFEVFLSADTEHVDKLIAAKLAVPDSRFTYATGRLALYAPLLAGVSEGTLKSDAIKHLAIANPKTAPYGAAAADTLRALGLWNAFQGRVVIGENIGQTFQFVETRSAEAGLVAYSQVIRQKADRYWLVPEKLHTPLKQDACLLAAGKDNPTARAYLVYLRSPEARKIIESFGYTADTPETATQ